MDTTLLHPQITLLRKGDVLPLVDAAGRSLAVFAGCVWITEEGDPEDVVACAGESHRFARPGLALVEALEHDTRVVVFDDPRRSHAAVDAAAAEREALRLRDAALADAAHRIADAGRLLWARL